LSVDHVGHHPQHHLRRRLAADPAAHAPGLEEVRDFLVAQPSVIESPMKTISHFAPDASSRWFSAA
jgi:hypothetical protein